MSSLVLELQQEAINPKVKVSDLLRKALVVATKLNITEFKEWIEEELHGYKGMGDKVPPYRHLKGEIKATHPNYGWIPYIFEDAATAESLSVRPNNQPIGELEHLLERMDEKSVMTIPFPPQLLNRLDSGNLQLGIVPTLVIDGSRIYGIVDAVRNIILEWSLKLERDNILGDGLTFSNDEKQKASSITYNIQNFTGVAGNVETDTLQIGDYNSVHSELKRLGISQEERNELESILDSLKTADKEERKPLVRRGTDWLMKNAQSIGSLSETIRRWLE